MTFGLLRPTVFLPADASQWPHEKRRLVLLHELAHIERGDIATHLLARIAFSLYWWNPLMWLASRELLNEQERAADDLVLGAGTPASAYATCLLDIARAMNNAREQSWAAVPMARRSQLEDRLMAILNANTPRQSTKSRTWIAATIAIALVAPIAAIRAQQPAQPLVTRAHTGSPILQQGAQAVINGDYATALPLLQQVQTATPDEAGLALMWMAIARQKEDQPAEAESLHKSALAVAKPNTLEASIVTRVYAQFLKSQNRTEEAATLLETLDALQKAITVAPPQTGPGVYRISAGGVKAPKLLSKVEPKYTDEARTAKLAGTVVLYTEICPDGIARNTTVVRALGLGLDENAIQAISQWQFQPGLKDDKPVTVAATIEVNFRLM